VTTRSSLPPWTGHAIVAAVLTAASVVHANALLNHDVAWLMIAGGRMLEGGGYLRDFFEVNMPLAIAAYIPPYAASNWLGLPLPLANSLCVGLLSLQSACLAARCLGFQHPELQRSGCGPWLCAWLLLGLEFLPGYDFGQKEHLVVILCLPWVCAIGGNEGLPALGKPLRLYLSALAALGFYLKPHYAPLPFLLLGLAAWHRRSWGALWSLELQALLLAAAAYAVTVLLFYPDWFVCARWAADLYGAFRAQNLHRLFALPHLWIYALCGILQLATFAAWKRIRPALAPILLCVSYAWLAYLLQDKGWSYQFLPVQLFTFAAQAIMVVSMVSAALPGTIAFRPVWAKAGNAAAALLLTGTAFTAAYGLPNMLSLSGLPGVLAQANRGDSVFAFSFEVEPFLPAVPLMGLNWASRYSHLWPLLQIAQAQNGADPRAAAGPGERYLHQLVDAVSEDFARYRPTVVLVDRRIVSGLPLTYDILGAFLADARFAEQWRNYARVGAVEYSPGHPEFEVYWRQDAEGRAPR
jgi:hypothetical protein